MKPSQTFGGSMYGHPALRLEVASGSDGGVQVTSWSTRGPRCNPADQVDKLLLDR